MALLFVDRVGHYRRHHCPDKTQTHHYDNFFAFLMGGGGKLLEPPVFDRVIFPAWQDKLFTTRTDGVFRHDGPFLRL